MQFFAQSLCIYIHFCKNETDNNQIGERKQKGKKSFGETQTMEAGKKAIAPKPTAQKTRSDPQSMELRTTDRRRHAPQASVIDYLIRRAPDLRAQHRNPIASQWNT